MAHPHLIAPARLPDALKERGVTGDINFGAAELAMLRRFDRAAELVDHGLLAVTDAEHGNAEGENILRRAGRCLADDGGRTARENDPRRIELRDPAGRVIEGNDFAVNPGLANAPGDQLRDLAAKIDNQNSVLHRRDLNKLTRPVQPVYGRIGNFPRGAGVRQLCFALYPSTARFSIVYSGQPR